MSDGTTVDRSHRFPGLLGMRIAEIRPGYCRMEMDVEEKHLRFRANGLHAGAVVSLADSACGAGCQASLEPGKVFSTVELKTNLISTASEGTIVAEAVPLHMGKRTHVWEARVTRSDGKMIAVFVCTQLIMDASV